MIDHIKKMDIQAFVDNELGEEEEERLRLLISSSPEAQKFYQNLVRQKMLLKAWWETSGSLLLSNSGNLQF